MNNELLYKEEVFKIIGAAIEVHKELGPGFLEAVYEEAMAIESGTQGISLKHKSIWTFIIKREN